MTITTTDSRGDTREAVTLRCDTSRAQQVRADVLVVVLAEGSAVPDWLAPYAAQVNALGTEESLTIVRSADAAFLADVVEVLAAPGSAHDRLRRAARRVAAEHPDRAAFAVSGLAADGSMDAALAFISGFAEARYRFTRYRSGRSAPPAELSFIELPAEHLDSMQRTLEEAEIVESCVRWCRDLTNTPAHDLTPALLAAEAAGTAQRLGASVHVHDETWLEDEGFAGLVSVGAGSPHPPRLVEVGFRGPDADAVQPIVLVGKGITFDSGGLSLKRASAMEEMKSDMAGAATALAAVCAIARMAPPRVHVIAMLALAENLPGPQALRPGDIIRHRNGRTTEVVNTDCEGRLVMSDVLSWAAERSPAAIIDIATLTYSTIAALGLEVTSVLGTDPTLIADIRAAGGATGDPYWELPLWEPYRRLIDSPFADLRNEEKEDGPGAITAGLYLREFVGDTPWAHLDTGGTAYLDAETDDVAAGATGVGVRSLVRLILDRQHAS